MSGGNSSSSSNYMSELSSSSNESHEATSSTSLSAINSQLIAHGWIKRPLDLSRLHEKDQSDVTSVLFEMIGSSLTNLESLEDLSSRLRTLTYEHERLQKASSQVKTANARLQTEIEGYKARCGELEKRLNIEESKVKELREENARGRKALEGVRLAALHEAKKSQSKLDKAQSQLLKISNDAALMSRPHGLVILNPIVPGKIAPSAPGLSPLLEQSISDLAEIRQSLQEETEAFRHVVVSTGTGLRDIIAAAKNEEKPARFSHSEFFSLTNNSSRNPPSHSSASYIHTTSGSTSHPSIADTRLKSLLSEVQAKFNAKLPPPPPPAFAQSTLTEEEVEERKRVEREVEKIRKDLEDKVKDLEVEIICAKAREDEAKKVVEEMARTQMQAGPSKLQEDDSTERDELHRQKMALQREKREYTKLSAKLMQERKQLEIDLQAFKEEQAKADLAAVMAHIPPTPPQGSTDSSSESSGSSGSITLSQTQPISSKQHTSSTPPSPFRLHQPLSPSPLSPHKRSPRPHLASKRKVKTPLSRLVLEKAARQNHRESKELGLNVLGESGRRSNVIHDKGKGKEKDSLASSTLKVSTKEKDALSASIQRDLSKAVGIGPRMAMKGSKVWR